MLPQLVVMHSFCLPLCFATQLPSRLAANHPGCFPRTVVGRRESDRLKQLATVWQPVFKHVGWKSGRDCPCPHGRKWLQLRVWGLLVEPLHSYWHVSKVPRLHNLPFNHGSAVAASLYADEQRAVPSPSLPHKQVLCALGGRPASVQCSYTWRGTAPGELRLPTLLPRATTSRCSGLLTAAADQLPALSCLLLPRLPCCAALAQTAATRASLGRRWSPRTG